MTPATPSAATTFDLPLVVLANQVVFPGDSAAIDVLSQVQQNRLSSLAPGSELILATARDAARAAGRLEHLVPVGVRARLENCTPTKAGLRVTVTALERVHLDRIDLSGSDRRARATASAFADVADHSARARRLLDLVGDLAPHLPAAGQELLVRLATDPRAAEVELSRACDVVGNSFAVSVEERAELLAAAGFEKRIALLAPIVARKRVWSAEVSRFVVPGRDDLHQLWPLGPNGVEEIERRRAAGRITADEARDLHSYVDKGYVVWERLISPAEVDALVADVRSIARHPGRFISTDHKRGFGFRFTDESFDAYESIFDTYVNFESARRIAFHPRVLRFLEILFDAPPIAMQQLLFQRSNQHPLHQDTAYVRVQQPLHLSATWVALEDVVEGRGELVYYEGSHRIPHQIFKDGVKWFNLERDDADAAIRYVEEESAKLGCPRKTFLAKKGDVFLWAADLVHGSAARTRPDHETRMSCVTHFVPKTAQPLWFMFSPDRRGLEPWGERAWLASSHYELPRRAGGMQSPTLKMPLPC